MASNFVSSMAAQCALRSRSAMSTLTRGPSHACSTSSMLFTYVELTQLGREFGGPTGRVGLIRRCVAGSKRTKRNTTRSQVERVHSPKGLPRRMFLSKRVHIFAMLDCAA
jgi:hypothetical protein